MTDQRLTLAPVVYFVLGIQLLPLVDGIAKYLSAEYSVLLIAWGRYLSQLVTLAPVALLRHRREALLPQSPLLQTVRGGLLVCCTLMFFGAVSNMPLADAIAIAFLYPFLVVALSATLLGENVGFRRWSAVVVGFIGVLVVLRPGGGFYPEGTPFAVGAGTFFALYVIVTRKLAGRAPPVVGLFYMAMVGTVALSVLVPWVWAPMSTTAIGLVIIMGVLTAIGHGLVLRAVELGSPSLLAPLGYLEIIGAVLVGLLLFGDFPDSTTWLGMAIIVLSGIYISLRETRLGARAPEPERRDG